MEKFMDMVLNVDQYLEALTDQYGLWIYAILFLIVFCETGVLFMAFLPGDSLLLAVGALAGVEVLNIYVAVPLFVSASALGSNTNYWVGRWIGPRAFHFPKTFIFDPKHLIRAYNFYEKYGSSMMSFVRFVPFVRTFAPFTAGVGAMEYRKFVIFDSIGAICWGSSLTLLGFWVGDRIFVAVS